MFHIRQVALITLLSGVLVQGCTTDQINMATQAIGMVTAPNGAVTPATTNTNQVPAQANANGRYTGLVQVMNCPNDRNAYGQFNEYGYWGGGAWCGQTGKAGYWVWVAPNWYVWQTKAR
jgi:hypothetical protein